MASRENVIGLAASVWPEAADITVQDLTGGHSGWTGPDPPTSGFVLLAVDANGGIIQRLKANTLDELQAEVEKMRQSKGEAGG
jgi:hypothetical protein